MPRIKTLNTPKVESVSYPVKDVASLSKMLSEEAQEAFITEQMKIIRRQVVMGEFNTAQSAITNLMENIKHFTFEDLIFKLIEIEAFERRIRFENPEFTRYNIALEDLQTRISEDDNLINNFLRSMVNKVQELTREYNPHLLIPLTHTLCSTQDFLDGHLSVEDYQIIATNTQRDPIIGLHILGGLMLTLALSVIVLSCIACPILFGPAFLAVIGGYLGGLGAVFTALTLAGTSCALLGSGLVLGFFGSKGRESDLGKTMNSFAKEQPDNPPEPGVENQEYNDDASADDASPPVM